MKKTIEQYFCDVCNSQEDIVNVEYPVIFHTDQTEGRIREPYISYVKIDLCKECRNKLLRLDAWGAMGHNSYKIREWEYEPGT